ncbi:MAG: bifunctional metallophosphatase/5'-nucleotidase [Bacteroidales bacterium]|nr:bifunctional metallophosphatase/5'-nucleotidase [Bacteroidales bacterium]
MKRLCFALWAVLAVAMGFESCETPVNQNAKNATVAVVSVNDMHSAIDLMPQFAAMVDSLRGVYPDLLVFSAGDNRTGNPINDQYDPVNYPMIALMNKVGFDLCAVGNHEWDGGIEALQRNITDADFPFLCANVILPQGMKLDVEPYVILHHQGLDIAVVGLLEIRHSGIPGAHPMHFKNISFKKGIDVLPEYQFLRDQAEVFILLSHLGYEDDLEVAERFPMLDAILGGHSHTLVEKPEKHNGVMVTQAGLSLRYATLTLFEVKDGKVVDVTAQTLDVQHFPKRNPEVQAMLDRFNSDERFNEALATATTPFDDREELGCMVTDAIRTVSGADFAFNNTGGIRIDHKKKGPITVKDVYNIDPFNNEIVVYTMTGAQLERFIMDTYKKNGRYPSFVSGMTYTVRTDADGYPKSVDIRPDRGRFSKEARYKVAMNSYMASTVRFESLDEGESQFMTSEEMVIHYLKDKKTVSYNGVRRAFH